MPAFIERKKVIEHLTPAPLPLYDPKKIYNVGDQFQDSNGVTYTTVNTNKKFYVLAKTFPFVILNTNVLIAAYLDPEWLDSSVCNTVDNKTIQTANCDDSSNILMFDLPASTLQLADINKRNWENALNDLRPNIATNLMINNGLIGMYDNNIAGNDLNTLINNIGYTGTIPVGIILVKKNGLLVNGPGVEIVFKEGFTPPQTILLSNTFSQLLANSNSIYFSYFFKKSNDTQPDNFSPLISQSNISTFWTNYIKSVSIDMTPPECCTVI